VQSGGIPIHVGGHSRAAAKRAGTRGDGFFPLGLDGDLLATRLAELRTAARAAGRDPDDIELSLGGLLAQTNDDTIAAAEKAGASRLVLSTTQSDLDSIAADLFDFAEKHIA
jgi:alkanesulfonate monooxygenase SsuD/methylene tetrahydromethanopterin reductase-like flavin-dependent oxidoreductase (luciferase family)